MKVVKLFQCQDGSECIIAQVVYSSELQVMCQTNLRLLDKAELLLAEGCNIYVSSLVFKIVYLAQWGGRADPNIWREDRMEGRRRNICAHAQGSCTSSNAAASL